MPPRLLGVWGTGSGPSPLPEVPHSSHPHGRTRALPRAVHGQGSKRETDSRGVGEGTRPGSQPPSCLRQGPGAAVTVGKTEGDRPQRAEYEAERRQGTGHLSPSSTLELSFCDGRGSGSGTREEEASAKITLPSVPPLQEASVGRRWESGRRDAPLTPPEKGWRRDLARSLRVYFPSLAFHGVWRRMQVWVEVPRAAAGGWGGG